MRDDDWFKPHPDRPAALPRQPKPGEEVWRLRDSDTGRVQTCELRDNSRAGAGWEVQIIEAGEILVSRRCENEREARYVAEAARKDSLRTGSTAVERDGASGLFSLSVRDEDWFTPHPDRPVAFSAEDYADSEPQHHRGARCRQELIANFQADARVRADPSLCSATSVEQAERLATRQDGQTSCYERSPFRLAIGAHKMSRPVHRYEPGGCGWSRGAAAAGPLFNSRNVHDPEFSAEADPASEPQFAATACIAGDGV